MSSGWRKMRKWSFMAKQKKTYNFQNALRLLPSRVTCTGWNEYSNSQTNHSLHDFHHKKLTIYKSKRKRIEKLQWCRKELAPLQFAAAPQLNFSFCSWTMHASTPPVHSSWHRLGPLVLTDTLGLSLLLFVNVLQVLLTAVRSRLFKISVPSTVWNPTVSPGFTARKKTWPISAYTLQHEVPPPFSPIINRQRPQ